MRRGFRIVVILNEVRIQKVKLYNESKTQTENSKCFSLNKSIISRILEAYKKKGDAEAIRNPRRPKKTSNYFDKQIVKVIRGNHLSYLHDKKKIT